MTEVGGLRELGAIAVGGAAGAVARWLVGTGMTRWASSDFPSGTLAVNVLGCLALGFVMERFTGPGIDRALLSGVAIGFLGAFTTYSTFGYETFRELQQGAVVVAIANVALHVVLGLTAVAAGAWLGR